MEGGPSGVGVAHPWTLSAPPVVGEIVPYGSLVGTHLSPAHSLDPATGGLQSNSL